MSTKYNSNEPSIFGLGESIYGTVQKMETFTTSSNDYDLDYIIVRCRKQTGTVNATFDIFAVDGSNKPTGASLGSVTVLEANLPASYAETTFTFASPVSLMGFTTYALVCSSSAPASGNAFLWEYGFTNTGLAATSSDGGSSWSTPNANPGLWFQAWGTLGAEALMPPSTNLATIKRLVVASNDEIWYEDI